MTQLVNGTFTDAPTISPTVVRTKDRQTQLNGWWFEARFNHPSFGLIVIPCATADEAAKMRLKA